MRLALGLNPALYTVEWLDRLLCDEGAGFAATDAAAMVVQLRDYPTGVKACVVVVAAGDHREIIDVLRPGIEDWARSRGCTKGIVESFPAWSRLLRPHGYSPFKLSLIKDI